MVLAKVEGNKYTLVDVKCGADREIWVGSVFEPGKYVLQLKAGWLQWDEKEIVVSVYGPSNLDLVKIPKIDDLVNQLMIQKASVPDNKGR